MSSKEIYSIEWAVERHGVVDEITEDDGAIKWRVEVWDGTRAPFLTRYFNTREAASHFMEKIKKGRDDREG